MTPPQLLFVKWRGDRTIKRTAVWEDGNGHEIYMNRTETGLFLELEDGTKVAKRARDWLGEGYWQPLDAAKAVVDDDWLVGADVLIAPR